MFYKEIAKFDTPEEFAESLKYHGSARPISILKPSIVLKNALAEIDTKFHRKLAKMCKFAPKCAKKGPK